MPASSPEMSFAKRIWAKLFGFENSGKAKIKYPLYWLAPVSGQRIRPMRICSLLKHSSVPERDRKVINYATHQKLKHLLSFLGLGLVKKKAVSISLVRVGNCLFVEKGMLSLRLASLLNIDFVMVSVREYDYPSLKKRMHLRREKDIDLAGVVPLSGRGCDYYGISPAQVEVLKHSHRVPLYYHPPRIIDASFKSVP